jgi:hypothetical protein
MDASAPGNVLQTRPVFMSKEQQLREGWTATFEINNGGGKWNLVGQTPGGLDLIDLQLAATTTRNAVAAMLGGGRADSAAG